MVTDASGLPVDFRYTDPVTPTRLQRALYGNVLDRYLRAEVVLRTLLDALDAPPSLLLVDDPDLLDEPIDGLPRRADRAVEGRPDRPGGRAQRRGDGDVPAPGGRVRPPVRVSLPDGVAPRGRGGRGARRAVRADGRAGARRARAGRARRDRGRRGRGLSTRGAAAPRWPRSGAWSPGSARPRRPARWRRRPRRSTRPGAAARGRRAGDRPRPAARRAAAPRDARRSRSLPPPLAPVPRAAAAAALGAPVARAGAPAPATAARRCAPSPGPCARRRRPGRRPARAQRRRARRGTCSARDRLAAAWEAVQRDHGGGLADLRLLGVFGPLPLGAVSAAALEPDGRLRVTLGRPRGPAGRATWRSRATPRRAASCAPTCRTRTRGASAAASANLPHVQRIDGVGRRDEGAARCGHGGARGVRRGRGPVPGVRPGARAAPPARRHDRAGRVDRRHPGRRAVARADARRRASPATSPPGGCRCSSRSAAAT